MDHLIRVERESHWRSLHDIRREVLFETGIFPFVYDENHPDDRAAGNMPYLLMSDETPIGVVRLDRRGTIGVVRLVGIREAYQRRGHGRMLSALADRAAAADGITQLCVNAFVGAIGFYEKTGWQHAIWDAIELAGLNGRGSQMTKTIPSR